MKVIDMLNKIANGEEVKFKILNNDEIRDEIFEVENGHLRNSTCGKWLETKVSHDTWESISNYFLNKKVEIIEEEKKIPEKLENEHEFYSYVKYEENKNEIDKVIYILKALNLAEEKIGNLNNSVNEIIDYLQSKGENND